MDIPKEEIREWCQTTLNSIPDHYMDREKIYEAFKGNGQAIFNFYGISQGNCLSFHKALALNGAEIEGGNFNNHSIIEEGTTPWGIKYVKYSYVVDSGD